jgi:integrase/recombinase XerD
MTLTSKLPTPLIDFRKGRKQRVVPFSFERRKALLGFIKDLGRKLDTLLFANRTETKLGRRNVLRDVKICVSGLRSIHRRGPCTRPGIPSPSTICGRAGSVYHLQKVLGHSTLEMTRRYANLMTEDLQAVHERVSLLSFR